MFLGTTRTHRPLPSVPPAAFRCIDPFFSFFSKYMVPLLVYILPIISFLVVVDTRYGAQTPCLPRPNEGWKLWAQKVMESIPQREVLWASFAKKQSWWNKSFGKRGNEWSANNVAIWGEPSCSMGSAMQPSPLYLTLGKFPLWPAWTLRASSRRRTRSRRWGTRS